MWLHMGLMSDIISNFDQLFIRIGANNIHIGLPGGQATDNEQCSNRLQLDLTFGKLHVNHKRLDLLRPAGEYDTITTHNNI